MRLALLAPAVLARGRLALAAAALAAAADPAPVTSPATSPVASPPAAAAKVAAPQLSAAEQRLISLGYKPQMRDGEKVYCRREAPLGSRIITGQHCGTVAQLETTTQVGREGLERSQRNTVNPMPH